MRLHREVVREDAVLGQRGAEGEGRECVGGVAQDRDGETETLEDGQNACQGVAADGAVHAHGRTGVLSGLALGDDPDARLNRHITSVLYGVHEHGTRHLVILHRLRDRKALLLRRLELLHADRMHDVGGQVREVSARERRRGGLGGRVGDDLEDAAEDREVGAAVEDRVDAVREERVRAARAQQQMAPEVLLRVWQRRVRETALVQRLDVRLVVGRVLDDRERPLRPLPRLGVVLDRLVEPEEARRGTDVALNVRRDYWGPEAVACVSSECTGTTADVVGTEDGRRHR